MSQNSVLLLAQDTLSKKIIALPLNLSVADTIPATHIQSNDEIKEKRSSTYLVKINGIKITSSAQLGGVEYSPAISPSKNVGWTVGSQFDLILLKMIPITLNAYYTNKESGFGLDKRFNLAFDKEKIKGPSLSNGVHLSSIDKQISNKDSAIASLQKRNVYLNQFIKDERLNYEKSIKPQDSLDHFSNAHSNNFIQYEDSVNGIINSPFNFNSDSTEISSVYNKGSISELDINLEQNYKNQLIELESERESIEKTIGSLSKSRDSLIFVRKQMQINNKYHVENKNLGGNLFIEHVNHFQIGLVYPKRCDLITKDIIVKGFMTELATKSYFGGFLIGKVIKENLFFDNNDSNLLNDTNLYHSERPQNVKISNIYFGIGKPQTNFLLFGIVRNVATGRHNSTIELNANNQFEFHNLLYTVEGQFKTNKFTVESKFARSVLFLNTNQQNSLSELLQSSSGSAHGSSYYFRIGYNFIKWSSTINLKFRHNDPGFVSYSVYPKIIYNSWIEANSKHRISNRLNVGLNYKTLLSNNNLEIDPKSKAYNASARLNYKVSKKSNLILSVLKSDITYGQESFKYLTKIGTTSTQLSYNIKFKVAKKQGNSNSTITYNFNKVENILMSESYMLGNTTSLVLNRKIVCGIQTIFNKTNIRGENYSSIIQTNLNISMVASKKMSLGASLEFVSLENSWSWNGGSGLVTYQATERILITSEFNYCAQKVYQDYDIYQNNFNGNYSGRLSVTYVIK